MLHDVPTGPGYMLWRLMIDARFQGRGLGRAWWTGSSTTCGPGPAATVLKVGAHRGEGGPGPFYETLGFRRTGEVIDGDEDVYALAL